MSPYSESFKAKMVQKMASPGGPSANALAQEVGIHQSTLSRWLRAGKVEGMASKQPRRPQDWTAAEKLEAVLEASSLSEEDLGGFLRRKGLYRTHLEQWRQQMLHGLAANKQRSRPRAKDRQVRELEKELRRKDAALAETAALLVLKKKARAIWGDADDSTPGRSGR
jgi:transposase-like protein